MTKSRFERIRELASQGKLDGSAARAEGFDWVGSEEMADLPRSTAVVIGAGPAAFGFVKTMIDEKSVSPDLDSPPILVLECAETPGARSVYGGAFWPRDPVIFPHDASFFDDCPRDRTIAPSQDRMSFLAMDGKTFSPPLVEPSTVLRNRTKGLMVPKTVLYPWMWGRLEEARSKGWFRLRTGVTVDKLILDATGSVVGVKTTAGQRFLSRVVVDGSGAGAFFARDLAHRSLRNDRMDYYFGAKLVLRLEDRLIQERFGLRDADQGCVREYVGALSERIPALQGMVAIYPGRNTLHLVVLYDTAWGTRENLQPHQVLNECLSNPRFRQLLDGAQPLEWSACRLPEIHIRHMENWSHPGYLPLGDALGLVDFLRKHGVNTAMASGYLGARLVHDRLGLDSGALDLSQWKERLGASWICKRILGTLFKKAHSLMADPRLFRLCAWMGKTIGWNRPIPAQGLAPRPLSEWIGLNPQPSGQPEIYVRNPSVCALCASESCRLSDPCPAMSMDRSGVPMVDGAAVDRPEWVERRGSGNGWKPVNSEGCLECGNCESACPWDNLVFRPPNNLRGKHGARNRGINYRYN